MIKIAIKFKKNIEKLAFHLVKKHFFKFKNFNICFIYFHTFVLDKTSKGIRGMRLENQKVFS